MLRRRAWRKALKGYCPLPTSLVMSELDGKRIGILVASGSEQTELTVIRQVLGEAGVEPLLVSTKKQELRGWLNTDWGSGFAVDVAVVDADAQTFDGLIMPGGVIAADTLRADRQAVELVQAVLGRNRPVAAVGHCVWVLIEAGALKGRCATSIHAIRTDVINAGATWQDQAAVTDGEVVTGRNQHDLPEFMAQFVQAVTRG